MSTFSRSRNSGREQSARSIRLFSFCNVAAVVVAVVVRTMKGNDAWMEAAATGMGQREVER